MNDLNILFGILFAWILMMILVILLYPKKEQKEKPQEIKSIEDSLDTFDSFTILDAISGLVSLGYKQRESQNRVRKAWELLGNNATTEQLIKKALII